MKERIILLIRAKNLTAAQFADEIGVQKSSISHIISGRNNASLDFIQKILLRYPEVNIEWLMFGKGPIFKDSPIALNNNVDEGLKTNLSDTLPPVDLFSEVNQRNEPENRKENELTPAHEANDLSKKEEIANSPRMPLIGIDEPISNLKTEEHAKTFRQSNRATKTLVKIVEFYSDNTYKEYFPE